MMTRILAHQPDLGNGVGLHYSGFHRFSAVPASPNQLLAPTQPRENRRHRSPIREVGLGFAYQGEVVKYSMAKVTSWKVFNIKSLH
jgi:hypothetical protein